jgi:hypothetical protein
MGKIIKIAAAARSEMPAYLAISGVKAFDRRVC